MLVVPDNALEASTTVAAPGVLPVSLTPVALATSLDADANSPQLLDLVILWDDARADQITLDTTFSGLTPGPVKINWSAN